MYLKQFRFANFRQEGMIMREMKACETSYPESLPTPKYRNVKNLEFQPITIFYGGDENTKTTLLNLIGEKLGLQRESIYEIAPNHQEYMTRCSYRLLEEIPFGSRIITAQDLDEFLNRQKNEGLYGRMLRNNGSSSTQTTDIGNRKEHAEQELAFLYYADKLQGKGLYLLETPEKYLSPKRQLEMANIIENYARYWGCQFLLVSESPFMLAIKDAKIYDMDVCPAVEKKWTALGNVRTYFEFFKKHENEFLWQLF